MCVALVLYYAGLSLVMDLLIVTLIIMHFFFCCNIANEAGETPLDIAKRLKHTHCEELVSIVSLCVHFMSDHLGVYG